MFTVQSERGIVAKCATAKQLSKAAKELGYPLPINIVTLLIKGKLHCADFEVVTDSDIVDERLQRELAAYKRSVKLHGVKRFMGWAVLLTLGIVSQFH